MNSLTIIVPVFNEERHVVEMIRRLAKMTLHDFEIIIVNDGSTDSTASLIESNIPPNGVVLHLDVNAGKTSSVREGLANATGEFVIIQDADLEYDPADIPRLLAVAQEKGGAVFGRRPSMWERPNRWFLASGVLLIDLCLLVVYRRWVRDHATCYKMMPAQMLRDLDLQSTGFEGCVEITAKLMRVGVAIHQVPISYRPRSAAEGKKLTWRYGWTALKSVWRWRHWVPEPETTQTWSERCERAENVAETNSKLPV